MIIINGRPAVRAYAETRARSIMISAFDGAVKSALTSLGYGYGDMAVVTRTSDNQVSSIEIDYQKLNILRAEISSRVYEEMSNRSSNSISIPLGTLLGSEYTAGYGPGIRFKIQFLQIPQLDYESKFLNAGINNILHRINITADLSYSIVMAGVDETFTVHLTAVAAQTVIMGVVPNSFTNVVETAESDTADDIFEFRSN
ncbi:MAG: sporulation protein YunB [Clostridia bacterium]|nr:sporulation protein YunB [Clostridia bacterium]